MYSFIIGAIRYKQDNLLVLENNGIGYEINVSNYTLNNLPAVNEDVKIYTYFQVSENGIGLYGFLTQEEKSMFLLLTSVSGVGPKAATSILSNISLNDLSVAIATGDIKVLSATKGIGKKTAERIVVELKDKVEYTGEMLQQEQTMFLDTKAIDEAVLALISLGINKNEALSLARNNATENSTAEEIIAKVLRGMGN